MNRQNRIGFGILLVGIVALFARSSAAGTIPFTATFTARDTSSAIVTGDWGGYTWYAFEKVVSGSGIGTASGFSTLSGGVTFQFGNLVLADGGWHFEDYGPGPGGYFNIYQGATLVASSSKAELDLVYDDAGIGTGTGTIHMNGPVGDPFYQELLVANGGNLGLIINSANLLSWNFCDPGPGCEATFQITGEFDAPSAPAAVPEPGTLLLLGTGLIGVAAFIRWKVA